MKTDLRKLENADQIGKFISKYNPGYTNNRFKCIRSKILGSYIFHVFEIEPNGKSYNVLTLMDHMQAICKIFGCGIMICVQPTTNIPYYHVY